MISLRWALGAIVAASMASASTDELQLFSRLLKRQEPGSPEYNCHDNCGQAIIQARNSEDVCTDSIFLTDYENCLQCAGPDNVDIWKYYGGSLSSAAEPCALSTTPLEGEQPDVGAAIPAGSSGGDDEETTTSATSATSASATAEEPTATETGAAEEPTTATAATVETTPSASETSAGVYPTSATTGAVSTTGSAGYATSTTGGSSVTPVPSATQSGNGTSPSTTSSVTQVTNAANALSGSSIGFYGALALGAWYAVAQ